MAARAHNLAERCGNPNAMTLALAQEGNALVGLGDPSAVAVLERGLALGQRTGSDVGATMCRRTLSQELLRTNHNREAMDLLLHDLRIMRRRAAWMLLRQTLIDVAVALSTADAPEAAATLYGAIHHSTAATARASALQIDALNRRLTQTLDEVTLQRLIATGEQLETEHAAAFAEASLVAQLPPIQ